MGPRRAQSARACTVTPPKTSLNRVLKRKAKTPKQTPSRLRQSVRLRAATPPKPLLNRVLKRKAKAPKHTPSKLRQSVRLRAATPPKTPLNRVPKHRSPKHTAFKSLKSFLADFAILSPRISSTARPGKNTRNNGEYSYKDIRYPVCSWPEFSLQACLEKFGALLEETQVRELPVDITPQKDDDDKAVSSELGVAEFTARSLTVHLNRALRACNYRLLDRPGHEKKGVKADRIGLKFPGREILIVGDIKVSWKWLSEWIHAPYNSKQDIEYRQVLSQVHAYMNATGCRWGYILTDREFLPLERGEQWGDIRVGEAVAWDASGQWNVAFAAWFLHALAAGDEWRMAKKARPSSRSSARLAERAAVAS